MLFFHYLLHTLKPMYVNLNIFKAYDIRGLFPEELSAKGAYLIARAFAEYMRGKDAHRKLTVVVGSDARPSSPELKKAVVEGLLDEGVTVIDMGFCTTPFHYYVVNQQQADGGLMITASHNPYRYNGIKLTRAGGEPLGEGMDAVKNITKRGIFEKKTERGTVIQKDLIRDYMNYLFSQVDLSETKGLHVVLDAGGGMTSLLLPHIVKHLPCRVTLMNSDLFFDMSHEPPNPMKEESLAALKNKVLEVNADFGVAFDPDGDRSGFITHNARFFRGDYIGSFFASEMLKNTMGAAVVYDVRASNIFKETIAKNGGTAVESRVGHRFIKELMKNQKALFAAELSGHFYFQNFWYMDSDFLPLLYFLQFLSRSGKTTDELLDQYAVYSSSGEVNFSTEKKENILEEISLHFKDAKETKWVDGLSVYYDTWWANIRPSNTEPLIRLNVEAKTPDLVKEKIEEIKSLLPLAK